MQEGKGMGGKEWERGGEKGLEEVRVRQRDGSERIRREETCTVQDDEQGSGKSLGLFHAVPQHGSSYLLRRNRSQKRGSRPYL
eukprot:767094-Hanusia_phi.AAC.5